MAKCYQKHPFEIATEDRLTNINAKIFEIKKKIQLSEGQRKSNYEENENEKQLNNELIDSLKREIKIRIQELAQARQLVGDDEVQIKKYLCDVCPLGNKTTEQIIENLDLKVIEQRKLIDLLKYERKSKRIRLENLEKEYEQFLVESTKALNFSLRTNSASKQISHLENETHKVLVQWSEAEVVKKKYGSIRKSLIEDSVKFENSLLQINELLKKQEQEIIKLEKVKEEAAEMRYRATAALMSVSARVQDAEQTREAERSYFTQRFDERKKELEKLEKRIFPATGRATAVRRDSSASAEATPVVEEPNTVLEMEEVFQKLMQLTGVTEPEQVFERFQSQRETCNRLNFLQQTIEGEKLNLEKTQNALMQELEAFKFASVKDKNVSQDKIAELKTLTKMEDEESVNLNKGLEEVKQNIMDIKKLLYDLCKLMEVCPEPILSDWTEDIKVKSLLEIFEMKFEKSRIRASEIQLKRGSGTPILPSGPTSLAASGPAISNQNTPREPEPHVPTYKELLQKEHVKVSVSEEEDDIPSRSYLKRQAQLIVDTKSRRKGYRPPYQRR